MPQLRLRQTIFLAQDSEYLRKPIRQQIAKTPMTSEVINLRTARKARARLEKEAKAQQNRTKFGRTKAQRDADKRMKHVTAKELDQKRIPRPSEDS